MHGSFITPLVQPLLASTSSSCSPSELLSSPSSSPLLLACLLAVMCDYFWHRTNTSADQGGDLADIVRSVAGTAAPSTPSPDTASWQFLPYPASSSPLPQQLPTDDFCLRDPLLDELALFDGGAPEKSASDGTAAAAPPHQKLLVGDEMKRPCSDLFSAVLQISPAKPPPLPPPMVADDSVKLEHVVQISSPRTPAGIKRRKNQAKKVVCIPAPAAATSSSRPSGEVVPSDLWAWRKYGQKPIKGSPYPRGYYRCSSSKGCSARKQVERSRTDPNMLVITYTSEHNHPWPTQRNALAGSTRSQPSKNSSSAAKSSSSSSSSSFHCNILNQALKEEQQPKESSTAASLPVVKEEVIGGGEMDSSPLVKDNAFDHSVFYSDDFFADLAELEQDPMSLIFSGPAFDKSKEEEEQDEEEEEEGGNKGMDQFINMFDWGTGGT